MSEFEVSFEFTLQQFVTVEADTKKEAIEKVQRGEYDVNSCENARTSAPNRKWKATRI